jgi:hypothetical protein
MLWPKAITPTTGRWRLLGGTRAGGRTLTGAEQFVALPGATWRPLMLAPYPRSNQKN